MGEQTRVLCVDDNRDAATSTAEVLRLHGFETRACLDGPSAVTAAGEFHPHVCLLDLTMPGMDGVEVADRIRATTTEPIKMVALTALWDVASVHRTHNAKFDAHLVKPVEIDQLLKMVAVESPV